MNKQETAWKEVAELAHNFLESLPRGWLAHTSGDVGLLNDFYIQYRKARSLSKARTIQPALTN